MSLAANQTQTAGSALPIALFVTSQGALNAYSLALQTKSPADYREAARQLHTALKSEMRRTVAAPAFTCEAASAPARKTRGPNKAKRCEAAALDLDAPLGSIPKAKRAVGAFTVTWEDGSETFVSSVVYRSDKVDSQWIAAYQAANRLRRLRSAHSFLSACGFAPTSAAFVTRFGLSQRSPLFWELNAARAMPGLLHIESESEDVFLTPAGSRFGIGDAERAAELTSLCAAPPVPVELRQAAPCPSLRTVPVHAMQVLSMRKEAARQIAYAETFPDEPSQRHGTQTAKSRALNYAANLERGAATLEAQLAA